MSVRIEPPPEVVENPPPPPPEETPQEPGPGNAAASAAGPPAGGPQRAGNTGQGAPAARAEGGIFSPEELSVQSAVRAGAAEMVPVISRMEPVGRRLDPDNPVPKATRVELKPRNTEDPPGPRRPRLSAPSPAAAQAPLPEPAGRPPGDVPGEPPSRRRYTLILGSFSKEANALELRERLEKEGLPAEVVPVVVNNQPWWRVMSGVFDDQAAAEAYGRELKRKDLVERPYIKIM